MRHLLPPQAGGWRCFIALAILFIPSRAFAQQGPLQCPDPSLASRDSAYANRFQNIFYTAPGGRSAVEVRIEEDTPRDKPLNFYSVGAGHIIGRDTASYYILTAFHVVEPFLWGTVDFGKEFVDSGVKLVIVSFIDGRPSVRAEILYHNERHDIALLKAPIDPSYPLLDPVPFGNAKNVRVGDELLVVGNPMGMMFSATTIHVAGLNRDVFQTDIKRSGTYIQTIPSALRGMSGSLAIDQCGYAVGMVQLRIAQGGDVLGLLKPIDVIERVLAEFRSGKHAVRGSVGIVVIASRRLSPAKRAQFVIPDSANGLAIMSVAAGSKAHAAGIVQGDVLLSIGGFRTASVADLTQALQLEFILGQTVDAVILRKGKEITLRLTIE